jgi:hypothetical protein
LLLGLGQSALVPGRQSTVARKHLLQLFELFFTAKMTAKHRCLAAPLLRNPGDHGWEIVLQPPPVLLLQCGLHQGMAEQAESFARAQLVAQGQLVHLVGLIGIADAADRIGARVLEQRVVEFGAQLQQVRQEFLAGVLDGDAERAGVQVGIHCLRITLTGKTGEVPGHFLQRPAGGRVLGDQGHEAQQLTVQQLPIAIFAGGGAVEYRLIKRTRELQKCRLIGGCHVVSAVFPQVPERRHHDLALIGPGGLLNRL